MNNDLFNCIENHIDAKAGNSLSGQIPPQNEKGAEFIKELAVREELQNLWNKSKKFENIKNRINSIHRQGKKSYQTMRYLTYAAAASLVFLLAIPGYQYFVKPTNKTLEMNEMEIKSVITFFDTNYKQISPTNKEFLGGESILFEWDAVLEVKTNLVITDVETRKIIFKTAINSAAKQYRINQFIGKGKYTWRLEGFEGEMVFVMK